MRCKSLESLGRRGEVALWNLSERFGEILTGKGKPGGVEARLGEILIDVGSEDRVFEGMLEREVWRRAKFLVGVCRVLVDCRNEMDGGVLTILGKVGWGLIHGLKEFVFADLVNPAGRNELARLKQVYVEMAIGSLGCLLVMGAETGLYTDPVLGGFLKDMRDFMGRVVNNSGGPFAREKR